MVILDTNIVSEMMRPLPNPGVVAWLNRQDRERVFSTVVTVAEINLGLALMPAGKRRDELRSKAYLVFSEKLAGCVLKFDDAAAAAFGLIVARRRMAGRPIGNLDAQIASIAVACGLRVATRDVRDLYDCGAEIEDPWAVQ